MGVVNDSDPFAVPSLSPTDRRSPKLIPAEGAVTIPFMGVPGQLEKPRRWRIGSAGAPPGIAGTYVLVLRSRRTARLPIGRLGVLALRPGRYLYVGSAFGPGGLAARVARHLRTDKPLHWHLDYLRPAVEPLELWWSPGPMREEHRWALALLATPGISVPLAGFGASDCRCPAHLFAARSSARARTAIAANFGHRS